MQGGGEMTNNSVGMATRKRVTIETMESLKGYKVPIMQDFISWANQKRDTSFPVGGLREDIIDRIIDHTMELNSKFDPTKECFYAEDLLEYVDWLRENGKQHLFLYKISHQHMDYLRELRRPEYHRRQLKNNKLPNCYNNPLLIWETRSPQLSAVLYNPQKSNILKFKWVETRKSFKPKIIGYDGNGRPIIGQQKVKERAVIYFRVNLDNGNGELCVQELGSKARKAILDEREKYCTLMQKLFRLDYFHLVPLEPAIQSLLIAPRSIGEISNWKVLYPGGGVLIGEKDPSLFQWLGILWKPFVGDRLKIDWRDEEEKFRVKIDAPTDEFAMLDFMSGESTAKIIQQAREIIKDEIADPTLRKFAEENDKHRALIKKLDTHITTLEQNTIDCRDIMTDYGASFEETSDILDQLNNLFPSLFKNKYQVICPDTRKPIASGNTGILEYTQSKDIPRHVECKDRHHRGKQVKHPTKGNIKPVLIHIKPPTTALGDGLPNWADRPRGIIDRFENAFGKAISRQIIKSLFLFLFASIYIGLAYGVARLFLPLIKKYTDERIYVVLLFLIILVLLIGLLVSLFGTRIIDKSISFLKMIITSALDLLPFFRRRNKK